MIQAILNLLPIVIGVVVFIVWIAALTQWDGEKHCDPKDCEHCPFPPCEDRGKNNEKE